MGAPLDLERLYTDHAQSLFAFLINFTRNEADTKDILQEVFMKLAQRPGLLDGVHEPRAFLLRWAHNLAIDQIRRGEVRHKGHERFGEEGIGLFASDLEPDSTAFGEALDFAMAELVTEQRAVVHLKLWEGYTFEQIGELLGISANTAASRYRYGLDKLRSRLRP